MEWRYVEIVQQITDGPMVGKIAACRGTANGFELLGDGRLATVLPYLADNMAFYWLDRPLPDNQAELSERWENRKEPVRVCRPVWSDGMQTYNKRSEIPFGVHANLIWE